jgi:hypothetical protein
MFGIYIYIDGGLYSSAYILTVINIDRDPDLDRLGFAYARRSSRPNNKLFLNTSKLPQYIRRDRD